MWCRLCDISYIKAKNVHIFLLLLLFFLQLLLAPPSSEPYVLNLEPGARDPNLLTYGGSNHQPQNRLVGILPLENDHECFPPNKGRTELWCMFL